MAGVTATGGNMAMRSAKSCFWAGLMASIWALAAAAGEVPVVIATGEGESHSLPEFAVFALEKSFTADTLKSATDTCRQWLGMAIDCFKKEDLLASEIEAGYPRITSLDEKTVSGRITVRFAMKVFNEASASGPSFGALCDTLLAAAAELGATLSMEPWVPADREKAEQEALIQAAAAAYPGAEAIAGAVRSSIYAVQSIEILEVTWTPHPEAISGDRPLLRCHARVKAVYQLAPLSQP